MINDDEGTFTVKGTNGNDHQVSFGKSSAETIPSCTYRDWLEWHIPCKHFFQFSDSILPGIGQVFLNATRQVLTSVQILVLWIPSSMIHQLK
jgi:hypothetical protein